jgi:hypothetical protein
MSAFISFPYPDRIELLVDGATCTPNAILIAATDKLVVSPYVPLAITGRGRHGDVRSMAGSIVKLSACGSVDETFDAIIASLEEVRHEIPSGIASVGEHFEIVVAAYSEVTGPRHVVLKSFGTDHQPAWTLIDYTAQVLGGGPDFDVADLLATGLSQSDFVDGAAVGGLRTMEFMRSKPGRNEQREDSVYGYWVGGHVDHAVICADGVSVTRLKTWPDMPGHLINPQAA